MWVWRSLWATLGRAAQRLFGCPDSARCTHRSGVSARSDSEHAAPSSPAWGERRRPLGRARLPHSSARFVDDPARGGELGGDLGGHAGSIGERRPRSALTQHFAGGAEQGRGASPAAGGGRSRRAAVGRAAKSSVCAAGLVQHQLPRSNNGRRSRGAEAARGEPRTLSRSFDGARGAQRGRLAAGEWAGWRRGGGGFRLGWGVGGGRAFVESAGGVSMRFGAGVDVRIEARRAWHALPDSRDRSRSPVRERVAWRRGGSGELAAVAPVARASGPPRPAAWRVGRPAALLGGALGCACQGGSSLDRAQAPPPGPAPSFADDVAPILERRCVGCHQRGGIAPYPLTDCAAALPEAGRMARAAAGSFSISARSR